MRVVDAQRAAFGAQVEDGVRTGARAFALVLIARARHIGVRRKPERAPVEQFGRLVAHGQRHGLALIVRPAAAADDGVAGQGFAQSALHMGQDLLKADDVGLFSRQTAQDERLAETEVVGAVLAVIAANSEC